MPRIKFQGHRSIGSGVEDIIQMFSPYMNRVAILVMGPEPFEQIFVSSSSWVKSQRMTLASYTHASSYTRKDNLIFQFLGKTFETYHEISCSSILSYLTLP